jgi:hypothetical protein
MIGVHFSGAHLGSLLLLVVAFLLLVMLTAQARAGRAPNIRPLPTFDELSTDLGRAAESGSPIHVTIGSGGLNGRHGLTSLAALQVLEGLVDEAVAYGTPPVVTVGDPTLLPLAEDVIRRAFVRRGILERYDPTTVRFVTDQPIVYAAGAADFIAHERTYSVLLAGHLGEEAALIANAAEKLGRPQSAAVDHLRAVGALYPTGARLGVGEELYAGAARLTGLPRYLASLQVQDLLRILLVVVIVLAAIGIF